MFAIVASNDLLLAIGSAGKHSSTTVDLLADRVDVGLVRLQDCH